MHFFIYLYFMQKHNVGLLFISSSVEFILDAVCIYLCIYVFIWILIKDLFVLWQTEGCSESDSFYC